jgi:Winged helix domain, variant/ATPase family associated with various cellular activities (AAA)
MSAAEARAGVDRATLGWPGANQEYLGARLDRLRLLLQRRTIWLRKVWKRDLALEAQNFQGLVITDTEADLLLNTDGAAEARFYEQDDEARNISLMLSEPKLHISEAAQAVFAAQGSPALEILGRLFHLGLFELDVLLLCLAPEIDSSFERLYAYIQDDAMRKYPTANLAVQMLGGLYYGDAMAARERSWVCFAPDAPLRRFRLIQTEAMPGAGWGHEPLRLDRRIGSYLLGVNFLDEQCAAFLRPAEDAAILSQDHEEIVRRLERRLRAWSDREPRPPVVNLVGGDLGSCKAIARQLCVRMEVALYALDPSRLPAPPAERQACYRLLERESTLLPCAYYLEWAEIDPMNRAEAAQTMELVQGVRSFLFLASREPLSAERTIITVRVPKTSPQTQFAVWKARLGEQLSSNDGLDTFLARMVQQFQFSPQQIHRVVRSAGEAAILQNPDAPILTEADLWLAARGHAVRSIEGLAEKVGARRSLQELILPAESLQQIREIASQVEQRNRVYEQWGFSAKLSRGRGIAALFAGPSGTGKTMAAEVLAGHLDLDLYRIDLAGVISKYIGETEKNLKRVFDAAEESGAILFFDEADALFGKRSEVRDSHDRYANIEINYLLQRMEDYRGLAILATNRKSLLDQAFLRRLRFLVDFPFPPAADRVRIWRGAFPPEADIAKLDYEFLGRLEIAGGNISNIALNAAFLAAGEGVAIEMRHVLMAARREYAKIDKLVLEGDFGHYSAAVQ